MANLHVVVVVALASLLVGGALGWGIFGAPQATTGAPLRLVNGTRDYNLDIVAADIVMGPGLVWHAWTYNGQVPGPFLKVFAGETLRIHVTNHLNITHSFHTHLVDYPLSSDGSQLNAITGIGGMAMIPAAATYTYEFRPLTPGVYYYHCHSADGNHTIQEHIAQGLYGAIEVLAADEPPVRDEALFMAERGFDASPGAPYFLMNGKGLPGGEHALEKVFAEQGVAGVAAQLNVTVPVFRLKAGETMRLTLVNIGDMVHSWHLHGTDIASVDLLGGRGYPANVVPLVPGAADRVLFKPTKPGLWLFHCHVVSHADGGMIGVLIVDPATGPPLDLTVGTPATMAGMDAGTPHASPPSAPASAGLAVAAGASGEEFTFAPAELHLAKGTAQLAFTNRGSLPHSFTLPDLGVDTGVLPPGTSRTVTLQAEKAGNFVYYCSVPGHRQAGMQGTLEVAA